MTCHIGLSPILSNIMASFALCEPENNLCVLKRGLIQQFRYLHHVSSLHSTIWCPGLTSNLQKQAGDIADSNQTSSNRFAPASNLLHCRVLEKFSQHFRLWVIRVKESCRTMQSQMAVANETQAFDSITTLDPELTFDSVIHWIQDRVWYCDLWKFWSSLAFSTHSRIVRYSVATISSEELALEERLRCWMDCLTCCVMSATGSYRSGGSVGLFDFSGLGCRRVHRNTDADYSILTSIQHRFNNACR